ncbi:MAG TPA: pyridoxal phosphate-dependent aminotransferase [Candidatus Eisenbacteria bacterium]|jgi:aspartate aminotransferase
MSLKVSRLAQRIGHSGTMALDERIQALREDGRDIVSLGTGQLDFDTPAPVGQAGAAAIASGQTRYTPVAGTPALRRAVQSKFERENHLFYGDDQVIVGAGAKSIIFHALLALVDPEDVVVVPVPCWPSYGPMVTLAGGRVIGTRLEAGNGYKLTAEGLMAALAQGRGRARGLILNSPHNPTGAVYSREEYARLAEVVQGENLWVISDEIYEHLIYDGAFVSFAALPGMLARVLSVNGVSKAFAMTGWRLGYAGGPSELVRAMEALQSHTSGNPSSVSQAAAEAALRLTLDGEPALTAERRKIRDTLLRRRELACRELASLPGVALVRPAGAFYVFADFSRHYGRVLAGRPVEGSGELAEYLLEQAGVAAVPGAVFGDDRCLRLSFATSTEELSVAMQRIRKALS